MIADDAYIARRLLFAGEWDAALAILGSDGDPKLRAEIAMERWFFQMEEHDEAEKDIAALDPEAPATQLLIARMAYSRLLFRRDPRPDDRAVAEAGYRIAAQAPDAALRGWAEFHWGVLLDNVDEDPGAGLPHYETALDIARSISDSFLESHAIRHIAQQKAPVEAIPLFRRSLHLRAAIGARPQILAAQAALAYNLPEDDPERAILMETFRAGAKELRIGWLLSED